MTNGQAHIIGCNEKEVQKHENLQYITNLEFLNMKKKEEK